MKVTCGTDSAFHPELVSLPQSGPAEAVYLGVLDLGALDLVAVDLGAVYLGALYLGVLCLGPRTWGSCTWGPAGTVCIKPGGWKDTNPAPSSSRPQHWAWHIGDLLGVRTPAEPAWVKDWVVSSCSVRPPAARGHGSGP